MATETKEEAEITSSDAKDVAAFDLFPFVSPKFRRRHLFVTWHPQFLSRTKEGPLI
jgi:hypothetical protein